MNKLFFGAILPVFILISGCATIPPLPVESNVAILKLGGETDIVSIDGQYMSGMSFGLKRDPQIELSPGQHTIVLRYSAIQKTGLDDFVKFKSNPVTFHLEARGGDVFEVLHEGPDDISQPDTLDKNVPIQIIQVQTGTGSVTPKSPEPKTVIQHVVRSEPIPDAEKSNAQPRLDQLKQQWQQATTQERKEFMQWVIEE